MATTNGTINSITIPESYKQYLTTQFMLLHEGDRIEDYKKQVAGFLFFKFPDMETMKDILIKNYDNSLMKIGI